MSGNSLVPRVLCLCEGPRPGPSIAVVTGLHGNENDPVEALRDLEAQLAALGGLQRGRLAVFSGNREALSLGRRHLARDLNRRWSDVRLATLAAVPEAERSKEDVEQLELYGEIERFLAAADGVRVVLDLHSFSGEGRPFALGTDRAEHRRLARTLGLSMVFGLQEALAGALSDFYDAAVDVCMAIETGRTGEPQIRPRVREFLLRILASFEMCSLPRLDAVAVAEPEFLRVSYRHPVADEDAFRMQPGFASFQEVARGELLATDATGPLYAPHRGWLLMPLYQEVGTDGFFLAQLEDSS